MKRTTKIKALALSAAALCGITATPAMAQNGTFAPGDLTLSFQQFGGTNTVMLNVGSATTYRNATANILNIANIGTLLSAAPGSGGFGATWYDLPNLWWGAAGVRSASLSETVVNGDPNRTLYASRERTAVGTDGLASSAAWIVGDPTTAATNIIQQNFRMETNSLTTTLVEPTSSSLIDNQNLFNIQGTPTISFGAFVSGVQGDFGAGQFGTIGGIQAEAALDLYRVLAVSPAGTAEPGPIGEGQYQGTFLIDQGGNVSYIAAVPEPTTMGATLALGLVAAGMRRRRRVNA